MSEDLYAKPDHTREVRSQKGEKEDGNMDEDNNIKNLPMYDNYDPEWSPPSKSHKNTSDKQQPSTVSTVYLSVLCPTSFKQDTAFKIDVIPLSHRLAWLHFVLRVV